MARFRLSQAAERDVATILAASAERWGAEGRRHYAAILAAAMRKVAADPQGPLTHSCEDLQFLLRSFHLRYARGDVAGPGVRRPVHLLYYLAIDPGLIEVVRVLHERTDPRRHAMLP